jgi:hypothetical protein
MTKIMSGTSKDHSFKLTDPNNFITGKQFFQTLTLY